VCDVAETCNGAAATCPPNSFLASEVICRPGASFCDAEESCPGNGADCRPDIFRESTTLCASQTCTNGVVTPPSYCAGTNVSSTCLPVATQSCNGYQCAGTFCGGSCSSDANCVTGYFCGGTSCQLKKSDGSGCGANNQCTSGVCTTFFTDGDGDGYGDPSAPVAMCGTAPPAGCSSNSADCCPTDGQTRPGQAGWFVVANSCGSFDYDCSLSEVKRWATASSCGVTPDCAGGPGFWAVSVPACGVLAAVNADCGYNGHACVTLGNLDPVQQECH
jgi:hypothetical protein